MTLNINGRMKVKTLKVNFFEEFGLTLRIYNGRSFADDESTLASIRKGDSKGGEFAPQRNIKIANLELKIFEMFGIKTQVSGSDDSYLCDDDLTLKAAQLEDVKKLERRAKKNTTAKQSTEDTIQQTSDGDAVHINAGWEKRDDRYICRWMVVWQNMDNGSMAGAFGGYSGGGSFQMEQFYAKHSAGLLTSLMIDMEDKVTGDDIDFFDDVPPEVLSLCDDAQDIIMDWHDEDEWEEADQLILLCEKQSSLIVDNDLLLLPESKNAFVAEILKHAGVTASPS